MLEFQISTIALTVLNLLILYVILRKLLFGRVNKVLDDRAALIQQTLDEAKGEKRKADELKQEYEDRLAQARSEANGILAQAKTRGEKEYQAILSQAQEDATRTREQSKARARAERDEMLRTARREVAQLAMEAASKVTRKALDSDSDRAILDDFLAEAGEKK